MLEIMIAVALSAGDPATAPPAHLCPCGRAAYRLASYLDACDATWGDYKPAEATWERDIKWLREQWWQVACAPDADDLRLFPDWEYTDWAMEENDRVRSDALYYAGTLVAGWRAHQRAYRECECVREAWDALKRVHATLNRRERRLGLAGLRELIGAPAYYRGQMPPPVPLWWNPPRWQNEASLR